jgi:hypothetical protein
LRTQISPRSLAEHALPDAHVSAGFSGAKSNGRNALDWLR